MDYLVRFVQNHESFRQPELEALARLNNINLEICSYSTTSPFCIIRLRHSTVPTGEAARQLGSGSVLSKGIFELWGYGQTYDELHEDVRRRSQHLLARYKGVSFRFSIDSFCGKRSTSEQRAIINSFRYLGFDGKIDLVQPEQEWVVFEEWDSREIMHNSHGQQCATVGNGVEVPHMAKSRKPKALYLGRKVGTSSRSLIEKHDLKQRPYISTTSMDAELALLTATLALAAPGKLFLDPFVGTGGFLLAAAELGAMTLGSDIDGRSFRGKGVGLERGIGANFERYVLNDLYGDCIIADLIHTPLRFETQTRMSHSVLCKDGVSDTSKSGPSRWLDGIICDPPYGVREGLKSLGVRTNQGQILPLAMVNGVPAYTLAGFIAPKRPYSFVQMLDDILDFAARTLVDEGRLAFWMPTANDEAEIMVPQHQALELVHCCLQAFNKWSRRLLVYSRKASFEWQESTPSDSAKHPVGTNADELNPFRRKYFKGFEAT